MKLKSRKAIDSDYMILRDIMIKKFKEDKWNRNWTFERLDWIRYHYFYRKGMEAYDWTDFCHIWESEKGDMVAAVLFDIPGFFSLQILPAYMDAIDYGELIARAEKMQKEIFYPKTNKRRIEFEIDERDTELLSIFEKQGYERVDDEYMIVFEHMDLQRDFPNMDLPEGYRIRAVESDEDFLKKNICHSASFGLGDLYPGDNFKHLHEAPGYKKELDLIVECGDKFAADCGAWFDAFNRIGCIEPLAVHPDYQKKGLGKAIIYEAFRRLRDMGALSAGMYAEEANRAFYTSVGYKAVAKRHIFFKELD